MALGRRGYLTAASLLAGTGIGGGLLASALPGRRLPEPWEPDPGTWPAVRYDPQNTAHVPGATPPTDSPTVAWTTAVGTEVWSVVVAGGTVFVGGEDALVALDASAGTERWRHDGDASTVAVRDTTVFAAGANGVRALDSIDGTVQWTYDQRLERCYHLLPVDDWLFVGAHGGVFALSADEGRKHWRFPMGLGNRGVAVDGDRIYVGEPGPATALESRSLLGEHLHDRPRVAWSTYGPAFGLAPVLVGDLVVVADGSDGPHDEDAGYVYAYEAHSGEERWRRKVEMNALAPATDGTTLYAPGLTYEETSDPGVVRALDVRTGAVRWSTRLPRWPSGTLVADDAVVVGGGNRGTPAVTALDSASGEHQWTVEIDGDSDALAAVGETVFAGTRTGSVHAIR
jgi:outer membrane protein assembly factor BamB